jgi:hypothetical protein
MVEAEERRLRLIEIEARLEKIELGLQRVITLIETNNNSCQKMDTHIDFVESMYHRLRYPFSRFLPLFPKYVFKKIIHERKTSDA